MALLPPTVGERLAKCGTTVVVWGVVPGANVELRIDGATQNRVVNDSWTEFTVASLNANQQVTARQTLAPDPTSADSPAVVVGDVQLPPPSPRLAPTIFRCAGCIYADGMVPGSPVTLLQTNIDNQVTIGTAVADGDGAACLGPKTDIAMMPVFGTVITCGSASGMSAPTGVIDPPAALPAPHLQGPVFGCQTFVNMDGLTQRATVEVFASG